MILSLLREGTPDPPISRQKPSRVGKVGILGRRSKALRRLQLGAQGRGPLARAKPSAPEVARSLLPALFIFQHEEPVADRRSVCQSELEHAPRLTP